MPINVALLILSLCGPGNMTSCRHDMTECYIEKHAEELRYGEAVDARLKDRCCFCQGNRDYPETALVYECAIDLGIPFELPVYPDEEKPSLESPIYHEDIQDEPTQEDPDQSGAIVPDEDDSETP